MTPRERVLAALEFRTPDRVPRQAWIAPWARIHLPAEVAAFERRWSMDIGGVANPGPASPRRQGDPHAPGVYIDEWGCRFDNLQAGVIGEVKVPSVPELARWRDTLRPPWETLPGDQAAARRSVDEACRASDQFLLAGCCPRPWERYQFLRGTAEAMADLAEDPEEAAAMIAEIHRFHVAELEFWAGTAVDGLFFMDDWGAQRGLLISPRMWRRFFKPLYADYCRIAHAAGKKVFMHSDGDIVSILPDLVEVGVDALNSQLGCMDLAQVAAAAKGRLTFWGEINRQQALPAGAAAVEAEVRRLADALWDPRGGIIAQFEWGGMCRADSAHAVFAAWDAVGAEEPALSRR